MFRPIAVTAYGPPPKHKAGERWPLERVVSDEEVLQITQAIAPAAMLRLTRQILLARFCRKPPVIVMRLLYAARGAKRSGLRAVEQDISLRSKTKYFPALADCSVSMCDAIRSDTAAFKRNLKKACQDPSIASVETWAKTKLLQSITQTWQCGDCDSV